MRYLNKDLKEITLTVWRKLYDSARYTIIERHQDKKLLLETSWVGVAANYESPPRIFLTRAINIGSSNKSEFRTVLSDIWSPTIDEARSQHAQRRQELSL